MSGHAKTEVLVSEIPFLDYVHAKNLKYWLIGQRILQPDGMDSTNYIWDKVFKNGPRYFRDIPLNVLKAVFYRVLLVPFLNTIPKTNQKNSLGRFELSWACFTTPQPKVNVSDATFLW